MQLDQAGAARGAIESLLSPVSCSLTFIFVIPLFYRLKRGQRDSYIHTHDWGLGNPETSMHSFGNSLKTEKQNVRWAQALSRTFQLIRPRPPPPRPRSFVALTAARPLRRPPPPRPPRRPPRHLRPVNGGTGGRKAHWVCRHTYTTQRGAPGSSAPVLPPLTARFAAFSKDFCFSCSLYAARDRGEYRGQYGGAGVVPGPKCDAAAPHEVTGGREA